MNTQTLAALGIARLKKASREARRAYSKNCALVDIKELDGVLGDINRAWAGINDEFIKGRGADARIVEQRFVEALEVQYGKDLVDYALMHAVFKGFAEGKGLPANRAEDIKTIPTETGVAPKTVKQERLTGADVPPFMRGRVFGALGKKGYSPDVDVL